MDVVIRPIRLAMACAAVAQWHRHHEEPVGHRYSLGFFVGAHLLGVAICGRPVARLLDPRTTIEVTRVATPGVDVDPRCRGACSALYKACAAEAERRGFSRILTYTLASETGYTLRAARWQPTGHVPASEGWHSRDREARATEREAKTRWEPRRALVPAVGPQGHLF